MAINDELLDQLMEGLEALEAFKTEPDGFDLVMTDMAMPKMSGAALAREILSIRPYVPIILCTGYSNQIGENKSRDIGIARLLMKPLSLPEVSRILHELLGNDFST